MLIALLTSNNAVQVSWLTRNKFIYLDSENNGENNKIKKQWKKGKGYQLYAKPTPENTTRPEPSSSACLPNRKRSRHCALRSVE